MQLPAGWHTDCGDKDLSVPVLPGLCPVPVPDSSEKGQQQGAAAVFGCYRGGRKRQAGPRACCSLDLCPLTPVGVPPGWAHLGGSCPEGVGSWLWSRGPRRQGLGLGCRPHLLPKSSPGLWPRLVRSWSPRDGDTDFPSTGAEPEGLHGHGANGALLGPSVGQWSTGLHSSFVRAGESRGRGLRGGVVRRGRWARGGATVGRGRVVPPPSLAGCD